MTGLSIQAITREHIAQAIRRLRTSRNLTQDEVVLRARTLDVGLSKLHASQVSDFERGKAFPSFAALLIIIAACSDDGETIDFGSFQAALEISCGAEPAVVDKLMVLQTAIEELVEEAVDFALKEKDKPVTVDPST